MKHLIDWNKPAKLRRAQHVSQFGDGYRQVSGTDIATGTVDELLAQARAMPPGDAAKLFIVSEPGGNPLTVQEVEQQAAERG